MDIGFSETSDETMVCDDVLLFGLFQPILLLIGQLMKLQPNVLQSTPVEYQGLICLFGRVGMIRRMTKYMGYPGNYLCKNCLDEEELVQHILKDCLNLQRRRQQCLWIILYAALMHPRNFSRLHRISSKISSSPF